MAAAILAEKRRSAFQTLFWLVPWILAMKSCGFLRRKYSCAISRWGGLRHDSSSAILPGSSLASAATP